MSFGGGEFLNTGMSLDQFGFMDEAEGSHREAAINQICSELTRVHEQNPFLTFDDVIDGIIEDAGLDPTEIYGYEKVEINSCMW